MEFEVGGTRKKNNAITSFQAVHNMLKNESARVKVISYKSLSGMIFTVNIDNNKDPQFVEYLDGKEKDVYSIALKFVIISKTWQERLVKMKDAQGNEYNKIAETLPDFSKEAQTQSIIFEKSENDPICPSVIDLSFFENDFGKEIIELLLKKTDKKNDSNTVLSLQWLLNQLNDKRHKLGMITMEFANNYVQLADNYIQALEDSDKKRVYKETVMLIVLLFFKTGVVLLDCHSGNIMVKKNGSRVIIIDFGRTLNIDNEEEVKVLFKENTIGVYRNTVDQYINTLKNAKEMFISKNYKSIDFIYIFKLLVQLDFLFNNISFRSERPQLTNVKDSIAYYNITNPEILSLINGNNNTPFPETKLELFSFKKENTLESYIRKKEDINLQKPNNYADSLEMIIEENPQQSSLEEKVENYKKEDIKVDNFEVDKFRCKYIIKKHINVIKAYFVGEEDTIYNDMISISDNFKPYEMHTYIACLRKKIDNPGEDDDKCKALRDRIDSELMLLREKRTGGRSKHSSAKRRRYKRTKNRKHYHKKTRKY